MDILLQSILVSKQGQRVAKTSDQWKSKTLLGRDGQGRSLHPKLHDTSADDLGIEDQFSLGNGGDHWPKESAGSWNSPV